jgi:RHS repeat-associated protein
MTPLGRTAVRTVRSDGDIETRYFHADGHGTIHAVTDEQGQVEQRFHYDPWGKQTEVSNSRGGNGGGRQTRGYTDHEMLNDYNLIHMNARLYDPVIARFISADRVVQDMGDSQTYNRYSYCANNPVNTSDPTGNSYLQEMWDLLDEALDWEMWMNSFGSWAENRMSKMLGPAEDAASKVGAAASADGNATPKETSLTEKGPQATAQAGKQSQSNGNTENSTPQQISGLKKGAEYNIGNIGTLKVQAFFAKELKHPSQGRAMAGVIELDFNFSDKNGNYSYIQWITKDTMTSGKKMPFLDVSETNTTPYYENNFPSGVFHPNDRTRGVWIEDPDMFGGGLYGPLKFHEPGIVRLCDTPMLPESKATSYVGEWTFKTQIVDRNADDRVIAEVNWAFGRTADGKVYMK